MIILQFFLSACALIGIAATWYGIVAFLGGWVPNPENTKAFSNGAAAVLAIAGLGATYLLYEGAMSKGVDILGRSGDPDPYADLRPDRR